VLTSSTYLLGAKTPGIVLSLVGPNPEGGCGHSCPVSNLHGLDLVSCVWICRSVICFRVGLEKVAVERLAAITINGSQSTLN
jgi:hypothetical protein